MTGQLNYIATSVSKIDIAATIFATNDANGRPFTFDAWFNEDKNQGNISILEKTQKN